MKKQELVSEVGRKKAQKAQKRTSELRTTNPVLGGSFMGLLGPFVANQSGTLSWKSNLRQSAQSAGKTAGVFGFFALLAPFCGQ
jgi:hypothetical protein